MAGPSVKRAASGRRPRSSVGRGAILAIDQGTTGTKALLLGTDLRVLAEASREFRQHFPRPGWVEHHPEEIFASVEAAVRAALARARLDPRRIVGVGITNQRETTILWDRKTGRALYPAIVWQDRRTHAACQRLKQGRMEEPVRKATGLLLDPYFSATKAAWILDHVAGARRRAAAGGVAFGTVDTYLLWRLTGGRTHATDPSNASRTLLMDIGAGAWSPELCKLFRVPMGLLPRIESNDQVVGETRGLGFLPDGIPISGVLGDQQAALFGQAAFQPGEAKCTYGTGAFLVLNTGFHRVQPRGGILGTVAWERLGKTTYALEGSAFIAGAAVQWLRDGLGIVRNSQDIEALAASVPDSGGVVFVPALSGLGAPHWDAEARGVISGLTRGSTRAHLARATLEGIAFQIRDLVEAMRGSFGRSPRALKVDGGATRNDLLLQIQADLLGLPVVRPAVTSTTALGAALLCALNLGVAPSLEALGRSWREDRRFKPRIRAPERLSRVRQWDRAVARALLH